MVSNDAESYALVKAEAAAGGAEGQPLQGYSSQRQLSTKVSGPTLAAASTPGRRVESTASACEIHPLKIQKSHFITVRDGHYRNRGRLPARDPIYLAPTFSEARAAGVIASRVPRPGPA
jgi:hypothetical protein